MHQELQNQLQIHERHLFYLLLSPARCSSRCQNVLRNKTSFSSGAIVTPPSLRPSFHSLLSQFSSLLRPLLHHSMYVHRGIHPHPPPLHLAVASCTLEVSGGASPPQAQWVPASSTGQEHLVASFSGALTFQDQVTLSALFGCARVVDDRPTIPASLVQTRAGPHHTM